MAEKIKDKDGNIIAYKHVKRYFDDKTGQYKRVSVRTKKDTPQARNQAEKLLNKKIEEKLNAVELLGEITLTELIELQMSGLDQKESQKHTKRSSSTSIKNGIGHILVSKLTPAIINQHLQSYVGKIQSESISIKKTIIVQALEYGYQYGYLPTNITHDIMLPAIKAKKDSDWKYLEKDELTTVLNYFKDKKRLDLARMCEVLASTGLRYGEMVALEYDKDINFDEGYIYVRRTYNSIIKVYDTPKSGKTRLAYFNKATEKLLKEQIIFAKRTVLKYGLDHSNKLLFLSKHGNPYTNATFNHHLQKIDIPDKKLTSHIFRHTYITRMVENGVPAHLIAEQVGHADTKMIEQVYLHFSDTMKQQLSNAISSVEFVP